MSLWPCPSVSVSLTPSNSLCQDVQTLVVISPCVCAFPVSSLLPLSSSYLFLTLSSLAHPMLESPSAAASNLNCPVCPCLHFGSGPGSRSLGSEDQTLFVVLKTKRQSRGHRFLSHWSQTLV